MKKVFAIVLCLALVLSLAQDTCGYLFRSSVERRGGGEW